VIGLVLVFRLGNRYNKLAAEQARNQGIKGMPASNFLAFFDLLGTLFVVDVSAEDVTKVPRWATVI
jgi:hypothetical protein